MALPEDCSVALLPIKPVYANAIIAGTKRVEFRKTRFRRDVTHVVVYASTPVQRIIGIFRVSDIDDGAPGELWRRHHKHGGISSTAFDVYYAGVEMGVAIGITDVIQLSRPLALRSIRVKAPQSFRYLTNVEIARLRNLIARGQTATANAKPA